MKYNFLNKIKSAVFFLMLFIAGSCALKPISSEYTFEKTDVKSIDSSLLGNGKVLVYNGAGFFHKIDNTARLNIWINEKPLGQLKGNEYIIIDLKNGKYKFDVLHIDLFNMKSTHEIGIDERTKVITIKPTFMSNKLVITNELPKNFDKFKYTKKRS